MQVQPSARIMTVTSQASNLAPSAMSEHHTPNGHHKPCAATPAHTSRFYTLPPGHLAVDLASRRTTAFRVSSSSPGHPNDTVGAGYYLYLPASHPVSLRGSWIDTDGAGVTPYPVLFVIHGSMRHAALARDRFMDWAEENQVVVIAPEFPADHLSDDGVNNYKRLSWNSGNGTARYDELIFQILAEVAQQWGFIETEKFSMLGYSGGGQFAHRFMYLHPDRLSVVGIGAPGQRTLIDPSQKWPLGTADVQEIFAQTVNVDQIAKIKILLVVGSGDVLPREGQVITRVGVMEDLARNYDSLNIPHKFVRVPGIAHNEGACVPIFQSFLSQHVPRLKIDHVGIAGHIPLKEFKSNNK